MPTNDKPTPGGRPKETETLERQALAFGLLEQTARRLRADFDVRLSQTRQTLDDALRKRAAAELAQAEIASTIGSRGSLTPDQVIRFADCLIRSDAGAVSYADGWIAEAPIEARSGDAMNCHCPVAPGLHYWDHLRAGAPCPSSGPVPA